MLVRGSPYRDSGVVGHIVAVPMKVGAMRERYCQDVGVSTCTTTAILLLLLLLCDVRSSLAQDTYCACVL